MHPLEKEERSGINLTALADNRLFFKQPLQERDDLGTGAGGIGGKAAVACAGGHVVLQRPLDRVYCVDRNAAKVRELPHGHAAFCRRFLAAAQEGHSLGAGADFVGREGRLRGAGGNALAECPSNSKKSVGHWNAMTFLPHKRSTIATMPALTMYPLPLPILKWYSVRNIRRWAGFSATAIRRWRNWKSCHWSS